jgi:dihydropyrimidine dehydrogenase (NAD+) subunit PreT
LKFSINPLSNWKKSMASQQPTNLDEVFCELKEPLDLVRAQLEASRCYYCYDAPCIQACPTHIDIPSFIRKIQTENYRGSAMDILSANIMGGTCARACPVETLCEKACVRNLEHDRPVEIGQLQRYSVDRFMATGEQPFKREKSNGLKVAVVGAGPAGLACAHELARAGYEITVYDSKAKSGGLNEYGLAPYKMTDDWAQREVDFILSVGGIEVQNSQMLGRDFTLDTLKVKFDAVFLGFGLAVTFRLGIDGEELNGVEDAVRKIESIRQATDLTKIPVGRDVVVIGGGNTAIDIAVEMKKLGAEQVTLVYRRGEEDMGATWHEREIARLSGVQIRTWAKPSRIIGDAKSVSEIEFEKTAPEGKSARGTGEFFRLPADQVFKAIGQKLSVDAFAGSKVLPEVAGGKLKIKNDFETTLPMVFAGGDCVGAGEDLTVTAVAQGKSAAQSIHRRLTALERK